MFLVACSIVKAQIIIKGKIIDEVNAQPVSGALISLNNSFAKTYSNDKGEFLFSKIKINDKKTITVTHISYNTFEKEILTKDSSEYFLTITLKNKKILSDEVVVASIRANKNTPTTFYKIDKEEIDKQNLGQDITFLLNQTPSIVTSSDAGAGIGYTNMRIRGSDQTRINVTVNGIALNDAESHNVFWVNMPDFASSIDNIQIQRGVGTSTNGAAAFGASIDLQTTKIIDSAYAEISNSYGSFNSVKNTIKLGTGLLKNKFVFDGRLSHISSEGYIDRASVKLLSYYTSAAYYGKNTIIKFITFSGKEKTYQAWWGVPQDSLASNRTYNYYNYPNETDNYTQSHYQLLISQQLNKKLLLNIAGHYTKGGGYFEQYRGPEYNNDFGFNTKESFANYGLNNLIIGNDTITETSLIRRRQLNNHFYGFTYSLNYNNLKKLNLILGGAWNNYKGLHFGEIIWSEFSSNGTLGHRFYQGNGNKSDLNIYLKVNYAVNKKLNLFADFQNRYVQYSISGTDIGNAILNENVHFNFLNPKAGVSYFINSKNQLYTSFAIANREPVRSDFIDNPNNETPRHETLYNIETGYQFNSNKFLLIVNHYFMHYQNQLVLTGKLNDVGAAIRTNVPNSYKTGVELQTIWKIHKKFSWHSNATYSINKIKAFTEFLNVYDADYNFLEVQQNQLTNKDIAFSPRLIMGSTINYLPINNLQISFISKYVSKQYLDNTESESRKLNSFFVNNININYTLLPQQFKKPNKFIFSEIKFQLLLNNIFNTLYENNGYTFSELYNNVDNTSTRIDYNYYYPQANFNFMFGISFVF